MNKLTIFCIATYTLIHTTTSFNMFIKRTISVKKSVRNYSIKQLTLPEENIFSPYGSKDELQKLIDLDGRNSTIINNLQRKINLLVQQQIIIHQTLHGSALDKKQLTLLEKWLQALYQE